MTLGGEAAAAGTLGSLLTLLCAALPGLLGWEERSLPGTWRLGAPCSWWLLSGGPGHCRLLFYLRMC